LGTGAAAVDTSGDAAVDTSGDAAVDTSGDAALDTAGDAAVDTSGDAAVDLQFTTPPARAATRASVEEQAASISSTAKQGAPSLTLC
jgi:hypothetical protein